MQPAAATFVSKVRGLSSGQIPNYYFLKAMNRDQGSNAKHHQLDQHHELRDERHEEQRQDRQGWVRKYLDLADRAFRDDNGNDPTPNPA